MKQQDEIVLSFTSTKSRLPHIDDIFRNHFEIAGKLGIRLCFSCQDDALPYMTEYQSELVKSGKIELLHIEKDHGSNTKWTLCRAKHPSAIMIVVDDDWLYDVDGIRSLIEAHNRHPTALICRAYRAIPFVGDDIPLYAVKPSYTYPKTVTPHLKVNRLKDNVCEKEYVLPRGTAYPEHFLGTLYPPEFPSSSPDAIPDECRKDDDVYVGARAAAEGVPLVFAGVHRISEDVETTQPNSLWETSRRVNGAGTFRALKSVHSDFTGHLSGQRLGDVYLLTCKKYPRRRASIKRELARLGITYHETYDDGSSYPSIGMQHKHLNRCHLAKLTALGAFLKTSKSRVTIIEDDVRFLTKISEVSKAVSELPTDFGACRLSWSPSPYIRKEMETANAMQVAEIDREIAREGSRWVRCPWASTDGCTIITRRVAEELYSRLVAFLTAKDMERIDNSDDLLCRVCEELKMPMYVYKPLVCIQVVGGDVEFGKSTVHKFLDPLSYRIPGIVRPLDEFSGTTEKVLVSKGKGYSLTHRRRVVDGPLTAENRLSFSW